MSELSCPRCGGTDQRVSPTVVSGKPTGYLPVAVTCENCGKEWWLIYWAMQSFFECPERLDMVFGVVRVE